jgi:hypothetical protein
MMDFYHRQLTPGEKQLYSRIAQTLGRRSDSALLPELPVSLRRLREISLFVTLDNPDYYWTKGSFELRREKDGLRLRFPPLIAPEETREADERIASGLTALLAGLPPAPMAAAEALCRRLVERTEYEPAPDPAEERRDQSIWSVCVRGKRVCMGLAKALCLALRLAGFDSVIVLGSVFGDRVHGHSWVQLRIGERWLHLDPVMGYDCFYPLWEAYHPGVAPPAGPVPFELLRASHELRREFPYPGVATVTPDPEGGKP